LEGLVGIDVGHERGREDAVEGAVRVVGEVATAAPYEVAGQEVRVGGDGVGVGEDTPEFELIAEASVLDGELGELADV